MKFLPISVDIENETILIIGGGKLAVHKIESLEKFTHKLKVIAPEVVKEIEDRPYVQIVRKKYEASDLEGHLLVYAATENKELDHQIRLDGRRYRSLVNVVDKPETCDFISPAIYRQDQMTVAVSSNGENVFAAIHWRNQISDFARQGLIRTTKSKSEYRKDFS